MEPVKAALQDAHLTPAEIEEVVLVGGTTRTPLIRSTVQEFFGRKPHTELNPDEVVALGAAVQGEYSRARRQQHAAAGRHPPFPGH